MSNYDSIPTGSQLSILVYGIKSPSSIQQTYSTTAYTSNKVADRNVDGYAGYWNTHTTWTAIARAFIKPFYSAHIGISEEFKYKRHIYQPLRNLLMTAANSLAPDTSKTLIVTGINQPGELLTFNFTDLAPSSTLTANDPNDLIMIQFPTKGYDRENRYTISVAPSSTIYMMPADDIIVIKPGGSIPNPTELVVSNIPNP